MKLLACVLLAGALWAAPPEVGDTAQDFTLPALDGRAVRLSEVQAQSRVVLVVLRGYPGYQCPVCNRQVQDLIRSGAAFAEAGVRVLLVYPGGAGHASEFLTGKTLPPGFDLLLDPDYKFTNLYGLRWDAPRETAYPSTFLIGRDGKIFFSRISKTHGGRTTAAEILEALRGL